MNRGVVVAGHICLDITPVFTCDKVNKITDILKPGQVAEVKDANISTGGPVSNTGLAMKILGADTNLICKVGCDEFGDLICSMLDKYDTDKEVVRTKKASTSYSVVLAMPGVDRIFLHNSGANDLFGAVDVSEDCLSDAALFHFGYPTLMKCMYENEGDELVELYRKVKSCGVATSMDLSLVDSESTSGKADWKTILTKVMPYVDFFVPSIEEVCAMIDPKRHKEWQLRAGDKDVTDVIDFEHDVKPVADECIKLGAKVLLLKCGILGMYLCTAELDGKCKFGERLDLDFKTWSNLHIFEKPYKPGKVRSALGAGDTSIAAFLTGILNKETPEMCLKLATGCAACCVEEYDALSGLISYDELKDKINSGWEKL